MECCNMWRVKLQKLCEQDIRCLTATLRDELRRDSGVLKLRRIPLLYNEDEDVLQKNALTDKLRAMEHVNVAEGRVMAMISPGGGP
jgi:hypothetical protein